jgi:Fic family protein
MRHNLRMKRGDYKYIWQRHDWPAFNYDAETLAIDLANASRMHGELLGRLSDVGLAVQNHTTLVALTDDVMKTSEIEGERFNVQSVRSSIARRLGVDIGALAPVDRHAEGVVEMILDATAKCHEPLTQARLFAWHAALFPTGYSSLSKIKVAHWRDDRNGAMQVVSGVIGKERIHFEAPPAKSLTHETKQFLKWANAKPVHSLIIQSGLAHLWFVTLHPFDDGNGRIARAIGDLFLARADGNSQRFYSLSAQIQRERKAYYDILERTQKGSMDVTPWLLWFLETLGRAIEQAHQTFDAVLVKAHFWQRLAGQPLNERQSKMLNRLLDGLEGKLTSSKWATMAKCSPDSALRDINELVVRGILKKSESGGRSQSYELR